MPYTGKTFAKRHNKNLTGHAATVAAKTVTALEKQGMATGKAFAIANAQGNRLQKKQRRHTIIGAK